MRSTSVAPDLSSARSRVSDTVSTAIFSAMNCLLSSIPGITRHLLEAQRAAVARLLDGTKNSRGGVSRLTPENSRSHAAHSCADAKVLQLAIDPDLKPAVNQRWRCSALPCVKESGTT